MATKTISKESRRQAMVRQHHLGGDAAGPEAVTAALVALHATDPATVYLSVLARSTSSTLADVSAAMYEQRSLVRWMAMRRTLFLVATTDVPLVQAAISTPLAAGLRRRLVTLLQRNGSHPLVGDDVEAWLSALEQRVEESLRAQGPTSGARLGTDIPALRTAIAPLAPSDRPQNVTSSLLTIMGAQGRIVRSTPTGAWTSRHHLWESADRWWPQGLPPLDPAAAQRELARRWLSRFGPATIEDLQWWTGWNMSTTRGALAGLPLEEVNLHGTAGIDLIGVDRDGDTCEPVATLLPSLDPTPMGWKQRDWFFGIDAGQLFDTAGNIGPTLWWDGQIVGSWAVAADGEVRTALVADRGAAAAQAVDEAAARLQVRLEGAVVTPAIRTTLERSLRQPPG